MKVNIHIFLFISTFFICSNTFAQNADNQEGLNNPNQGNPEAVNQELIAEMIKITLQDEYKENCPVIVDMNRQGCCILKGLLQMPNEVLVKTIQQKDRAVINNLEKKCK